MAIDIRATVTCSLGTLISGSISDDYLQGSGLVKTRGSVEISALITPAIGTAVTFSYTKGGVTRSIPRKLRVMSSFADPFRHTTTVELGCKLTYLSDLQEAVDWSAFDDPANSSYTEADQRIVTLPISAASAMNKCLTELGITASSNPLINKFSIAAFDFSAGYVQVLSDLLVSESYFGYLDANEVLQVRDLTADGGTGPVYTQADIVDLGPINTGQLPGEAVTVSYSTLKLKEPDPNADEALINWESSFSSSKATVVISYGDNQTKIYTGVEYTTQTTIYDVITVKQDGKDVKKEVPVKKTTTETRLNASVAGGLVTQYLNQGFTFSAGNADGRSEEYYTYDAQGNEIQRINLRYSSALEIVGQVGLPLVFSDQDFIVVPSGDNKYLVEKIITKTFTLGEYTRTDTAVYGLWNQSIPGQQSIAEARDSFTTASAVLNYINATLNGDLILLNESTETRRTGRVTSQERPPAADRINAANSKDGDPNNGWRTESTADLELALGSATAQRRIEFSMPYAPDDTFSGPSGGPFTATASNAPAKANRYGRVQNRLLLGNRNGMNIQLAPERLPAAPFAPMYVQANGLTALYRANGNQWAFSSDGIVCSTDALFWAAVGGTGTFWFPVAPGVTSLPATPPIVDGEMNATTLVLPYNETVLANATLRLQSTVTKFNYALELLTEPAPIVIRAVVLIRSILIVDTPTVAITLEGQAPTVSVIDPAESLVVSPFSYEPTGSTISLDLGFAPGIIWPRDLDQSDFPYTHTFDIRQGATKSIAIIGGSNSPMQKTDTQGIVSFDPFGFTVGTSTNAETGFNDTAISRYGGHAFLSAGPATSNTDGTITSTVCVGNVYSVITYTGTGGSNQTVGHGLPSTPQLIFLIRLTGTSFHRTQVGGPVVGDDFRMEPNNRNGRLASINYVRSANSTTFTIGGGGDYPMNASGSNYLAYAFCEKTGVSKISTYTGNDSPSGQYIECDFQVDFVLIQVRNGTQNSGDWLMFDRSDNSGKRYMSMIYGSVDIKETPRYCILEDTGFRVLQDDGYSELNGSSTTYLFMAFARRIPGVKVKAAVSMQIAAHAPTVN